MTTRLTIRWDGTAPGLAEHTLSLGAWLEPLALLLKAVRRAWADYTRGEAERRSREAALLREVDRVDRMAARVALG